LESNIGTGTTNFNEQGPSQIISFNNQQVQNVKINKFINVILMSKNTYDDLKPGIKNKLNKTIKNSLIYLILGNEEWKFENQLIEDFFKNETKLLQINEASFKKYKPIKTKRGIEYSLEIRWNRIGSIETKEDINKYIAMIFKGFPAIFCKRCGLFVYKYFLNKIYIIFLNLV
jgi:hypothetical protein